MAALPVAANCKVVREYAGLRTQVALGDPSTAAKNRVALPRLKARAKVCCAVGDVSAEGTNYLIAGAVAVALIGTAFPILFARKDTCPVCDGAGFVRSSAKLSAAAGRKDDARILCPNCNGLGKINQTDK